jgi:fumiquinazoline A oxidase
MVVTICKLSSYDGFTTNASLVPVLNELGGKVRDRAQKASGYPTLSTYVNFAHGDEGPEAWFTADKLPRLRALKATYDPHNLFSYFNPLVNE